MRSIHRNITAIRIKDQKGKAPDIKSKSILINQVCLQTIILNVMSTIRNKVQLIGNVGNAPEVRNLDSDKKGASFSIATNEFFKNSKGEKVQNTQWHNIVAWGKTAEIVEKYVGKGKEIAIEGKLTSRSYETNEGEKRYVTEVVANEILLLGNSRNGNESDS
jgi:single-strand DNA-binding protein